MSDDNKKYYFSQIFFEEIKSFLTRAVKENLPASIWQKGQGKDEIEEFVVKSFDPETMLLKLEFDANMIAKLAGAKNTNQNILIKITFGPVYIFSHAKLEYKKEGDYYFVIFDKDTFKSQQRSNYRLNANKYVKIQFKIDGSVFDALDISAGGTSFIVPKDMSERFLKGKTFSDCTLRLVNTNYTIPDVKIAGTWDAEYKDESGNIFEGIKLGVAFVELPKKTEEDLFLAINTEARGEEIRKKALAKAQGN